MNSERMAEQDGTETRQTGGNHAWYPPVALWQLYLLIVMTLGLYEVFWAYRTLKDLRRHKGITVSPGLYAFGLLIPVVSFFVMYGIIGRVKTYYVPRDGKEAFSSATVLLLYIVANTVSNLSTFADELLFVSLAGVLVFPAPFLLMQQRINAAKILLESPRWESAPNRFTGPQWTALLLGLVIWGFGSVGFYYEYARLQGDRIEYGEIVSSGSGRYSVTVPSGDWRFAPPGMLDEDADIELYGGSTETYAFTYLYENEAFSIDDIVFYRRSALRETYRDIGFKEERELVDFDGTRIPVSYARYAGHDTFSQKLVCWVATAAEEEFAVEVVGCTSDKGAAENELETLVRSLRLAVQPSAS